MRVESSAHHVTQPLVLENQKWVNEQGGKKEVEARAVKVNKAGKV